MSLKASLIQTHLKYDHCMHARLSDM